MPPVTGLKPEPGPDTLLRILTESAELVLKGIIVLIEFTETGNTGPTERQRLVLPSVSNRLERDTILGLVGCKEEKAQLPVTEYAETLKPTPPYRSP